jgi:signal transduction histidine kinase
VRPGIIVTGTAVVAAAVTLITGFSERVSFAYESPSLHVALEAAAAVISGLAAYLVYGRVRESCLAGHLLLVAALAIYAFANLFFSALPGALGDDTKFETWAPLAARTLATVLFAASVIVPDIRVRDARRAALATLGASAGALAAIGVGAAALSGSLPVGIDPGVGPHTAAGVFLEGHAVLHGIQLANAALFAFAAVGFTRKAAASGDELLTWFAAGSVLSAFARVNYFLFPSLYSDWVYTGDVFRLGFYVVLLVGLAREIERYWRGLARVAVLEERRRIARDLHSGLAQELAFIAMQSKYLAGRESDSALSQIAGAADRALDESRRAIAALTRPLDEPLAIVLADGAEEVADRVGVHLDLALSDGVDVPPQAREALLGIVREAVTNAARHGQADVVRIELSNTRGIRLRISDNGRGFDPPLADTTPDGFGLANMRRRAQALGADLDVRSKPGSGTEIEVALP